MKIDPAIKVIRERRLATRISLRIGVTQQAVSQWRRVPAIHVYEIAPLLDMSPHQVRPDVFPRIKLRR
jgi:hypothetical protein